jgi:L-amino acid N-acyltransferase YncA
MSEIVIGEMRPGDWEHVRAIYAQGIATRQATFETETPAWPVWDAAHLPCSRLIAREGEAINGWAALGPVSSRKVYAGVAEVSVYVAESQRGKGIGRQLLEVLISSSENNGIWTLQAGIFPENTGSIALHRRCGFRLVGGRDTILLERRSRRIGIY